VGGTVPRPWREPYCRTGASRCRQICRRPTVPQSQATGECGVQKTISLVRIVHARELTSRLEMTINQLSRHFFRSNCILGLLSLSATHLCAANTWTLIGWSDFGINQMERDYSLYVIYPPYGTVHAQLIDPTGTLPCLVSSLSKASIHRAGGETAESCTAKFRFPRAWSPVFNSSAQNFWPALDEICKRF
jgi:hypothetical protein